MIRFDNGPPGGDYVRYIDELMAQRAAALVSATTTTNADAVDGALAGHGRKNPMSSPAFKSSDERSRDAKTGANISARPHASVISSASNNASQRSSMLTPAEAAAIASAMMTRDHTSRAAPLVGAIAIAIGAVSILIGILGSTSNNVLFIVAGIALVSWAVKRLGASAAPAGATTAVDVFSAAPMRRTSSRIKDKN